LYNRLPRKAPQTGDELPVVIAQLGPTHPTRIADRYPLLPADEPAPLTSAQAKSIGAGDPDIQLTEPGKMYYTILVTHNQALAAAGDGVGEVQIAY
jgi:hypothetical protein